MNQIKVYIRPATKEYPKHIVTVHTLKFDSIRQETYWVLTKMRAYRLRSDAETFAARFEK